MHPTLEHDGRLAGLALGTLNTSLLLLVLVLTLHLTGRLPELLEDLNTALGLAVFALLWAVTSYCTYQGLQSADLKLGAPIRLRAVLGSAFTWGARNGMIFTNAVLVVGVIVAILIVLTDDPDKLGAVFSVAILGFGIGTVVSAAVGAILGVAFALVDAALLAFAHALTGIPASKAVDVE